MSLSSSPDFDTEFSALCAPGGTQCPYGTDDLPGIDGELGPAPEDFRVDEIPAYGPAGTGDHVFVKIRKRGLSTPAARDILAKAAGVSSREVGVAGRKDTVAITTQWFSTPKAIPVLDHPQMEILESHRHPKKLRMGHLHGNRFTIRVLHVHPEAAERMVSLAAHLSAGIPNYFGPQRFGWSGRSLGSAFRFLENPRRRVRDPRFLASVAQSFFFNLWLGERMRAGSLTRAYPGDVLTRRETGGLFCCEDGDVDSRRMSDGELDLTGPLFGPKMMQGLGPGADGEEALKRRFELHPDLWSTIGRFAPGGRRTAVVRPTDFRWTSQGDGVLLFTFTLPPGSYATTVLAELMHPPAGRPQRRVLDET